MFFLHPFAAEYCQYGTRTLIGVHHPVDLHEVQNSHMATWPHGHIATKPHSYTPTEAQNHRVMLEHLPDPFTEGFLEGGEAEGRLPL